MVPSIKKGLIDLIIELFLSVDGFKATLMTLWRLRLTRKKPATTSSNQTGYRASNRGSVMPNLVGATV